MVQLQSVEGYIANVRIEGEVLGPRGDLEAYAERIRGSRPLRAVDLERYILLVNELAGTTVRATLVAFHHAGRLRPHARPDPAARERCDRHQQPRQQVARALARLCLGRVYSLFGAFDRTSLRLIQTLSDTDELTYLSGAYERPIEATASRRS